MEYSLAQADFEGGRGFVVVRNSDGQRLQWRTLPRKAGLESVNVVGEQYYALALRDQSFAPGRRLTLLRQPQNPFDANAIAVFNSDASLQVGFLPREDAKRLARALDKGTRMDALSIWEVLDHGRRVQIRVLLVKPNSSIDLSQIGSHLGAG
jgi:hypothetical protein